METTKLFAVSEEITTNNEVTRLTLRIQAKRPPEILIDGMIGEMLTRHVSVPPPLMRYLASWQVDQDDGTSSEIVFMCMDATI
jgi:hypothetical protein